MIALPSRDWSIFKQIFADHWEPFQRVHPRYQTAYYDDLVAKMLGCGNPEKMGYIEYRCLQCGQGKHLVAMSCKSSLCLRCAKVYVDNWVSQVSKVLHEGVIYRHIILTVPAMFRRRWIMASPQTLQDRTLDQTCKMVLFVALELSDKKWKLALSDGNKRRIVTIAAGELVTLGEAIAKAKARFGMHGVVPIVSCYEAGRDGFWLHRYLVHCGVANVVVDASSIEVNRRARRAKTDRVDVEQLLRLLIRYHHGEKRVWSVVRVPSVEEEDARRLHRELERLKKERTGHRNRIQALLVSQGVRLQPRHDLLERLEAARLWDGSALPPDLQAEVRRENERLRSVDEQIRALEAEQVRRLEEAGTPCHQQIAQLMHLRGIGLTSAWVFVMEYFGWRQFHNRKEVAALAGLTPMPYASGASARDQGISKAGNRRIRSFMIQIAWGWLRYQPHSALSVWFNTRFALGGKRMRRIGIVALARRLLIALWRYVQSGAIPESASLKPL